MHLRKKKPCPKYGNESHIFFRIRLQFTCRGQHQQIIFAPIVIPTLLCRKKVIHPLSFILSYFFDFFIIMIFFSQSSYHTIFGVMLFVHSAHVLAICFGVGGLLNDQPSLQQQCFELLFLGKKIFPISHHHYGHHYKIHSQ